MRPSLSPRLVLLFDPGADAQLLLAAVFEEMKDGGPLTPGADYGVKGMRNTLKSASPSLSLSPRALEQR